MFSDKILYFSNAKFKISTEINKRKIKETNKFALANGLRLTVKIIYEEIMII